MANAHALLVALVLMVPATALAHGSAGQAIDPPLHVDPTLEDCSVVFSAGLSQDAFRRFAREFGSVSAFKPGATAAPLGRRGVTFGIEQLSFPVEDHSDAWNDTFAHPDAEHELGDSQSFPLARARVGVTDRFDLGVELESLGPRLRVLYEFDVGVAASEQLHSTPPTQRQG